MNSQDNQLNLDNSGAEQQALNPNPLNLREGDPNVAKDPVCGNLVDKRTAQNTISAAVNDQGEQTLYFDGPECKGIFEENPQRFGYKNF